MYFPSRQAHHYLPCYRPLLSKEDSDKALPGRVCCMEWLIESQGQLSVSWHFSCPPVCTPHGKGTVSFPSMVRESLSPRQKNWVQTPPSLQYPSLLPPNTTPTFIWSIGLMYLFYLNHVWAKNLNLGMTIFHSLEWHRRQKCCGLHSAVFEEGISIVPCSPLPPHSCAQLRSAKIQKQTY